MLSTKVRNYMNKKIVVVVLGNRLNDDGTLSEIGKERLKSVLEIEETFNPDYYILSGGLANPLAGITEAKAMYNYLSAIGFNENKLVLEEESLTTVQNASYSIPLAKKLNAEIVIVCTSAYHLEDPRYKAMESFINELKDSNIAFMTYCK